MLTTVSVVLLVLVAGSVNSDVETYRHPQDVIQHAQSQNQVLNKLNHEDVDSLTELLKESLDLRNILEYAHMTRNVSEECGNQTIYLLLTMFNSSKTANKAWAQKMFDATAKPSSGIMNGELHWVGDYDECLAISSVPEAGNPVSQFTGQYCTAGLSLGPMGALVSMPVGVSLDMCVPSGCSEADMLSMIQAAADLASEFSPNSSSMADSLSVKCQKPGQPLTAGAIATIVVYAIIGTICVIATLYDYFVTHKTSTTKKLEDVSPVNTEASGHVTSNGDAEMLIPGAKPTEKPNALFEFLLCFSLYTNGYKLLSTNQAAGTLGCLNGIRFISMMWVILGHTIVFSFGVIKNFASLAGIIKHFTFQAILYAPVSVDSFFVLSGVLSCYLFLKQFDKMKVGVKKFLISVPIMYLHRYLRLTPAFALMIMFYYFLVPFMYEGPLKPAGQLYNDDNCGNNSWAALLYVNNIYEPSHMCAGWSWYLANDFQFFLVTPFIAYLLYRIPVAGIILTLITIVTSCGAASGISVKYDLGIGMFGVRDPAHPPHNVNVMLHEMDDYYFAPWARYQSYGTGVLFGYLLFRLQGKFKFPPILNLCLWAVAAILCLSVLYGPYNVSRGEHIASVVESAIYNGWGRTAWSIGLGYVILACCLGNGGWVNEFLSWKGFVPLSRMTYCAYLMHPVVMVVLTYSQRNLVSWNEWTIAYMFCSYLMLAYGVAFIFSVAFEAPAMLIDKKYITGKLSKSK